ncbi:MAG TPA: hypothetical protein VN723_11985 [Rhizomicrobium sp.]|nr:hypothetical protein [Rhizomicrobium sp.]
MALDNFAPLIGRWRLSGEADGEMTYRWADENRVILFQDFDIRVFGRHHCGLEVISHLQGLGEPPSPEIWSRAYMFNSGLTLDYVYEMTGRELTIWFRHKGSDNHMRGRISPDGRQLEAAWQWPGGGYRIAAERLTEGIPA